MVSSPLLENHESQANFLVSVFCFAYRRHSKSFALENKCYERQATSFGSFFLLHSHGRQSIQSLVVRMFADLKIQGRFRAIQGDSGRFRAIQGDSGRFRAIQGRPEATIIGACPQCASAVRVQRCAVHLLRALHPLQSCAHAALRAL